MKKFLALTVLAGAVLFSPAPQAADFDRNTAESASRDAELPRAQACFKDAAV